MSHLVSIFQNIKKPLILVVLILAFNGHGALAKESLNFYNECINYENEALKRINYCGLFIKKSVNVDSFVVTAHNNRGVAYREIGNFEAAIEEYTLAINGADQPLPTLFANRAFAYASLSNRKAASQDIKRAVKLDPTNPTIHEMAAEIYREFRDWDSAQHHLSILLVLKPADQGETFFRRGYTHLELRNCESAVKDFESALKTMPSHPYANFWKGYCLELRGEILDAIAHLEKAAQMLESGSELKAFAEHKLNELKR